MVDDKREKWIRDRATQIAQKNKYNGFIRSDIDNWLDAEFEYEQGVKHAKETQRKFKIT